MPDRGSTSDEASALTLIPTLDLDPDFQSSASYGHDPYTCKQIKVRGQLVQKLE